MIIDIHNHLGFSSDGGEAPIEALLKNIDMYDIAHLVLFAIDEIDAGETFENANDKVLNVQNQYPDKFIAFCRLNPAKGEKAINEFIRCRNLGAKGLKLKTKDGFSPSHAEPILKLVESGPHFPILIHVEHEQGSQPSQWEPYIRKFPKIPFILAHAGKDLYRDCGRIASTYPNVYLDTTTLSFNRTKWLYRQLGASKLVFGSDFPYSHPGIELRKYELIIDNTQELSDILYYNSARLLGLI